jgi:hypothetical protein
MKTIFMTLLSYFLCHHKTVEAFDQSGIMESIKENIRAEVSAIIFKALIGLVIAVATLMALLQFGRDLQVLFSQSEYGLYLEIATFGIVSALGCYLLYAIFRPAQRIVVVAEPSQGLNVSGVDVQGIFSRFTEGLVKGYQSNMTEAEINRNLQTDF